MRASEAQVDRKIKPKNCILYFLKLCHMASLLTILEHVVRL